MGSFAGTYRLTKSDGYEEYLKAIGVGLATRKIGASQTPTVEVQENGDDFKLKTITTFKTTDLAFKIGEEFVEETDDGRKFNTTVTRDGNTLVQVQKLDTLTATITRIFSSEGLEAIFQTGDIVSKRSYKRL